MIAYFLVSIINSLAQNHAELVKSQEKGKKKEGKDVKITN
jgi:hypothetical protein